MPSSSSPMDGVLARVSGLLTRLAPALSGMVWLACASFAPGIATAAELSLDPRAATSPTLEPLKGGDDDFSDDQENYRYDFSERHLSFGMDMGGNFARGTTLRAFPLGGMVSPYFRGAFGDGNALQFDLATNVNNLSAADSDWLFFRTPVLAGSLAWGYILMVSPTISFRYEVDMGSSISKRSRIVSFASFGLAPTFTYGEAHLSENNGSAAGSNTDVYNMEFLVDVVPTAGLKFRLGEFGALQVGGKMHFYWPIASSINKGPWVVGRPETVPEFWIESSRTLEAFVGFSYDFG